MTHRVIPSTVGMLKDVDLTGLADGDSLVWDDAAGVFVPGTGGGGATRPLASVYMVGDDGGGGGTPATVPGLDVGESITWSVPLIGYYTAPGVDLSITLLSIGPGTYDCIGADINLFDPITGDQAHASDSSTWSVPAFGGRPPALADLGNTGTTWTWSGTGYRRSSSGPFMGTADAVITRTS